jgi:hypothetical protein
LDAVGLLDARLELLSEAIARAARLPLGLLGFQVLLIGERRRRVRHLFSQVLTKESNPNRATLPKKPLLPLDTTTTTTINRSVLG